MAQNTTPIDLSDVHVTIPAGGSGTRLWPLSRRERPKQLLKLLGERSTLRRTVDRVLPLVSAQRIYILTGPEHARLIHEELPDIPAANILIEPSPRGTGPCLGLAAMRLRQTSPARSVMISLQADHFVADEEGFRSALLAAVVTARRGHIVTIGVVPTHAETGYGYIERGESLGREFGLDTFRVARFTEKPPAELAREYVASGRFYWNTGYFAWTLQQISDEFRRLLPDMHARLAEIVAATNTCVAEEVLQRAWQRVTPTSIDVGIMEHAKDVAVVPCDLGWNDVGSWAAMHEIATHDANANVLLGPGQHLAVDTTNSLLYSSGRLVATIGLDDIVVVDTGDAVLVLPKSRAQDVSALVKELRARGLDQYL